MILVCETTVNKRMPTVCYTTVLLFTDRYIAKHRTDIRYLTTNTDTKVLTSVYHTEKIPNADTDSY